jgi:hypothetical protein
MSSVALLPVLPDHGGKVYIYLQCSQVSCDSARAWQKRGRGVWLTKLCVGEVSTGRLRGQRLHLHVYSGRSMLAEFDDCAHV